MVSENSRAPEDSVTESSGNVFADLGLKDADTLMAKSVLAIHSKRVIKARRLTQAQAAEILGLDQPKVSANTSGRLEGFSMDRLVRFLNELGGDGKSPFRGRIRTVLGMWCSRKPRELPVLAPVRVALSVTGSLPILGFTPQAR
jgi:predicted XRE-type DNA-binding protein